MEYLQFVIILSLSPLLQGAIKKFKAGMQGRIGPGVTQPYFDLVRLLRKDMTVSGVTSWIFRAAPWIQFVTAVVAAMMIPVVTTTAPFTMLGDVIAIIYVLGLGRFFLALAGMDAGTAFGGEGSSREMTVAILVEPMV
ncbi:MAG: respiratory chain complex I subunit 1 family protein, partial [Thermodesulfovibrionales bacterium]